VSQPDSVEGFHHLRVDRAELLRAELVEEPGQTDVQPVVEVRLVSCHEVNEYVKEYAEHFRVGVVKHTSKALRHFLQLSLPGIDQNPVHLIFVSDKTRNWIQINAYIE